jgi:hypothetical protein
LRDNSKSGDWEFKAGKELWSKLPDFQYNEPSFGSVLSRNWLSMLSLLIWVTVGIWGVSRIKFSI